MREIILDNVRVADDTDAYVIAEIGHNHQGDLKIAKDMFRVAKECGAKAVKLQKRHNKTLFTKKLFESPYTGENSYGATYGNHREALEFNFEQYLELKAYAKEIGVSLISTAFDKHSADFLAELEIPFFKVASADLTNTPLLKHIARIGKPILLSTGGGSLLDVRRAYEAITPINDQLVILQCTACYPIENYEDMNLSVVDSYRREFPTNVIGISDHESGISAALVAFTLGARVVEKHFTLNRAWRGTDHAFSLAPGGLRRLVRNLQRARLGMGDGIKRRLPSEEKPLLKMSKKLVASKALSEGHIMTEDDIGIMSPGDGLPPYEIEKVIGKRLNKSLEEEENILFEFLSDK